MQSNKSWGEYIGELAEALANKRNSQWGIGDILVSMIDNSDMDRPDVLKKIAGEIGEDYDILDDHERTARRWKPEMRFPNLRWSVYQRADPAKDTDLIQQAADEGWSPTRFKEQKYPKTVTPFARVGQAKSILKKVLDEVVDLPYDLRDSMAHIVDELGKINDELKIQYGDD